MLEHWHDMGRRSKDIVGERDFDSKRERMRLFFLFTLTRYLDSSRD